MYSFYFLIKYILQIISMLIITIWAIFSLEDSHERIGMEDYLVSGGIRNGTFQP